MDKSKVARFFCSNCDPGIPNPGIGVVPIPGFRDYKNFVK